MDLDEFFARSFARARRGRDIATAMFAAACAALTFAVIFFVAAPNMYIGPDYGPLVRGVAIAGLIAGTVWMWRILRAQADPEAGARPWRYRDF